MAQIVFRAIEKEDLKLIHKWRNSDNVMPNCRQYRPLSMQDMEGWYSSLKQDNDYNLTNDMFVIEKDNKPIGVCGLVRIDWRNRKGEISFYIADISDCNKENISNSLLLLVDYAFKTLNIHKVVFPVYSFNHLLPIYAEILDEEYRAEEEYYWDGKYWDRIILSAYNDE